MKWKLLPLAVALATSCSIQAQSLEQAVANSLASNPKIKQAYNNYKSYSEDINITTGSYLPSVNLSASIGQEKTNSNNTRKTNVDTKTFNTKQTTLSIRQLIWDGSATLNNISRTKHEAEAARFQLLADANNKALDVTKVYLNYLKANEVLMLSEKNVTVHERIYKDIKRRTDSGLGSTSDMTQIETRIARARSNFVAAQNNFHDAETNFIRLVNELPQDLVIPEVDTKFIPKTEADALKKALANNPITKVASSDIDAAFSQEKMATGAFLPTFAIEAKQTWADGINSNEEHYDQTQVQLTMNYNLLNGGSDLAKSRKMAHQVGVAKDIRDNTYLELTEGTKLAWSAFDLTKRQKAFLQMMVDAASDTVIAYEKQFRIGKRTLLDLLNTENELFEARKSYIAAKYDNISAKYRVLNATGDILAEMRVATPEAWHQSQK